MIGEEHLEAFEDIKVLFKGPLTIPPKSNPYTELRGRKFTSANQVLRKIFTLYANIRPARIWPGTPTRFDTCDVVCVRENTEDVYTGEERWVDDDTVEGVKRITRGASTRIAETAFKYAVKNGRKKITAAHKANVCKVADGLFLDSCRAVAENYPDIVYEEHLADSMLTRMVQAPEEFDVLLCPNLYGDLISDLAGGIIGSLGLCPSGQFGERHTLFEPCHGSAPDIAGKGEVNPLSQVLSGAMMLQHLGEHEAANRVFAAVETVLKMGGSNVTSDLGGSASTQEMTAAIVKALS